VWCRCAVYSLVAGNGESPWGGGKESQAVVQVRQAAVAGSERNPGAVHRAGRQADPEQGRRR